MGEDERVKDRATEAPPEESKPGSDDPEAQADAILADSDARQEDRDAAPGTILEHRRSEHTVEPPD